MGIVNATPDSFSDGGRYLDPDRAVEHGTKLAHEGALVLDVGGESTRPGSAPVETGEELERVLPVVTGLAASGLLVSIDTRKPEVARQAVEAGAGLINDITGGRDPQMIDVAARLGVPLLLMHMQGEPRTMQQDPQYDDVVSEVHGYLEEQARLALAAGVPDVLLDPGIGFGKKLEHNRQLMRALPQLAGSGKVLVGASRKSTIAAIAGESEARDRDGGSVALHLWAASCGAAMVRVHDVRAHVQALRVWEWLHG